MGRLKKGMESKCKICEDPIKWGGYGWHHIDNGTPDAHMHMAIPVEVQEVEEEKPVRKKPPVIAISQSFEFDTAHRVYKHGGKCNNLHGHRYKLILTVSGTKLTKGMLIDFGEIKEIVGTYINVVWDHTTVLCNEDPLNDLIGKDPEKTKPVVKMSKNPTAENIAVKLFKDISHLLFTKEIHHVEVRRIRLYETPNCYADYYGEGLPDESSGGKRPAA